MPGAAFHLVLLDLTIDALKGGSADDQAIATIMSDNHTSAALGALGTEMLRYRPVDSAAIDTIEQTQDLSMLSQQDQETLIQQIFPNPEMAPYATAYRQIVPFYADLIEMQTLLADLAVIADNEDVNALEGRKTDVENIQPKFQNLQTLTDALTKVYEAGVLANIGGRPPIQAPQALPAVAWRGVEYLRWKGTGDFAKALVDEAEASNDDRLRAYAYGYLTHLGGTVTGEPFVNSIVGGPYRTHWWRNKWVRNYVDSWSYGRYETPATMAGHTPTPDYADWKGLCGANLQDIVKVDGALDGRGAMDAVVASAMPATPEFDAIAKLLSTTANNIYGGGNPLNAPPPVALTDIDQLREAYVGLLSVLWFMTGEQPLCPPPPGPPPPGAEVPPDWYGSGGGGASPPSPGGGGGGSSTASTISAIIAAILGVIALIIGNLIVGIAAIIFLIAAIATAPSIDWDELRKNIYWLRMQLFQLQTTLQEALVKGALSYPLPLRLGTPPAGPGDNWQPAADESSVPLTVSREGRNPWRMQGLPSQGGQPALPPDGAYLTYPTDAVEQPNTQALFAVGVYADRVIDGMGLQNGGMMTDLGAFPTRNEEFGDALANSVDIIRARAGGLANYNLDGDRGYGWKTWRPQGLSSPADPSMPVQEVPE